MRGTNQVLRQKELRDRTSAAIVEEDLDAQGTNRADRTCKYP